MTALALCAALTALYGGEVDHDRLCRAAHAIVLEADGEDPALIAAIAHRESRFDAAQVNARGCWGAMQVCGRRPRRWTEAASYAAGVRRLREGRAYCRRRGTPTERCLMAAYAGGPALVRRGGYSGRAVLARAALIRRAATTTSRHERQEGT